ncbi:MAG: FecR domain-containing protein, partial [Phycisphaerales bacterium]|nr:FecR domain-containing protein [Phycisphaerales bacterium]
TPRTPAQPAPAPAAPAVAPAPVPSPAPIQPEVPIQVGPEGSSAAKPTEEAAPAPIDPPAVAGAPSMAIEVAPHVSIVPAPVAAQPESPAVAGAPTGIALPVQDGAVAIDIESVAAVPAKGALRQSPVEIGAQEQMRSARQVVPIEAPSTAPGGTDATSPALTEAPPHAPTGTIVYDQSVPNPAAALLPPAPVQAVLSTTFVENWPSGRVVSEPPVSAVHVEPAPVVTGAPVEAPAAPVAPDAPAPALAHTKTPAATTPAADVPTISTPIIAAATPAPTPAATTPEVVAVKEPVVAPPLTVRTEPTQVPETPVVVDAQAPRPLEVQPAPEPLPPVTPAVAARPTPIEPTPAAPSLVVEPAPVAVPAPVVVSAPITVEPVRPVEVGVPEVAPLDTSKIKLVPPATVEAPVATAQPAPMPIHIEPAPEVTDQPSPVAVAPADPVPSPAAPLAQPIVAGTPEPVSLRVLSLTGTPGMVQWQVDGGSQWLIPELDESTKGKFIVRTGPDAGVEVLLDESTRVRLGRFSRAEVRNLTGDQGAGQLSISLLRGVVYVVPGKGKSVSVQTPQRTVVVKEPTQVTHDNGGTRMVSFTEQPNPGTTAGVPSANP